MVRLILTVLWFIFGSGFVLAVGYGLAALICFALIVTIPFGVASFKLAAVGLFPLGKRVVETAPPDGLDARRQRRRPGRRPVGRGRAARGLASWAR